MNAVIRTGVEADLPRLCALYEPYVRDTAVTFDIEPPTLEQRRAWFVEHFVQRDHVFLAMEVDRSIAGFGWSGPFRAKAAYGRTSELSIYLARDHIGRGYGSALLLALLEALRSRGQHRAVGGLTVPNPASRAMLLKHGFSSVGVFSEVGEKLGRYWDVEWFERAI